jgi:hypothetical protein
MYPPIATDYPRDGDVMHVYTSISKAKLCATTISATIAINRQLHPSDNRDIARVTIVKS